MIKLTVKASGHQVGTLVAVMTGNPSNTSSSWVVGKLIRADRGYGLVSTADECVSAWGASKAVYITTPNATQVAAWHRNGVSEAAAQRDLWERSMCLGYTSDSAATVADCFTNWDHVSDACPVHPNHSTTMRDGYLVDACEACEIIARTDAEGYYPGKWDDTLAAREAEHVKIMEAEAAFCDDGKCGTCADCVECAQVTEDPKGFDEAMAEAERDDRLIADQRARKAAEAIECNADESLRADERDNMTGMDMIRELLTIDL